MQIIEDLKKYILETFGWKIDMKPIVLKNVPIFLKNLYSIYSAFIFNEEYLFAIAKDFDEHTPTQIAKHMAQLEEIEKKHCIYVAKNAPAYTRKRLVVHRVSFVIPYVQIFLPILGTAYRKTSKILTIPQKLSPSDQAVLIFALINGSLKPFTPSELANQLHYTRISMTRSLNTLEGLGIGNTKRKGKERLFYFQENGYMLWKNSLPYMRSPVKKILWIIDEKIKNIIIQGLGYISGLSALALKSKLISPSCPVYAIYFNKWEALLDSLKKTEADFSLPIAEEAKIQLEIWSYDPDLFDENNIVDDFSLYLSLKDQRDERVEKALENLIENKKW